MDFVTGLAVSTNQKGKIYDSILAIIDQLIKMINYKPIKITIDALGFTKIIINVIIRHHCLPNSLVSNCGTVFISKFRSSISYFLRIKRGLLTAFYPQTDDQIKRQNNTIEAYVRFFVNYEQNNQARLFLIAKSAYNNIKNTNTGHTPLELNCGFHSQASYNENVDF